MNVLHKTVGGHMDMSVIETDRFKRNILMMTYMLPISSETTAMDILLPGVLLRGSVNYPTNAEIAKRYENLFGTSLGYYYSYVGDDLMINFYVDFLSDSVVGADGEILRGAAELLSQIWLHPVTDSAGFLRANELDKVKRSLCDSIRADDNDTAAYASKKCREIMCAEEPCGYSISVDDITCVTPKMISERYFELTKSSNLSFFYVGANSAEKVANALDLYFGDAVEEDRPVHSLKFYCAKQHPVVRKERTMQVTQGKLSIGIYAGGTIMSDRDDYYATLVAVEIFGGSPISKLFMNVRERLGLCYYCGATYNKQKGIIYVSAGIDSKERENTEREINTQLDQMRKGNISEDELQAAKLSMINVVRQISDRPYSMWSFCHIRTTMGLSTSIDRHIERILKVSVQDVVRVASTWTVGGVFFVNAENGGLYED